LSQNIFRNKRRREYSEEEIVEGIKENREDVLRFIYKKYLPATKKMVYTFNNSILEPEEIFQEGLTRTILNIREGNFRRDSKFWTYLNAVCYNVCLKKLKDTERSELHGNDIAYNDNSDWFELLELVSAVKDRLNKNCKKIIDLRFKLEDFSYDDNKNTLLPYEEISEILEISPDNARQRFKRCLNTLKELVKSDDTINAYFG